MMNRRPILLGILLLALIYSPLQASGNEQMNIVMQLTRDGDNYAHRRAMFQIDRVLNDLGQDKLHIEVVAYENGIHALLANNEETNQFLTKLANRGVVFKACQISMRAWGLKEEDFPLEVEFIPAGATEMIRLQSLEYKYWRP
ncbi:MAG: DsrE family protein [Gammaproteobacteria bacterium]|nr:DsrE family protein [Gammaproteobacteria bacterium]